jgi:hypothetical protein
MPVKENIENQPILAPLQLKHTPFVRDLDAKRVRFAHSSSAAESGSRSTNFFPSPTPGRLVNETALRTRNLGPSVTRSPHLIRFEPPLKTQSKPNCYTL